jgi:hypothetical protein
LSALEQRRITVNIPRRSRNAKTDDTSNRPMQNSANHDGFQVLPQE